MLWCVLGRCVVGDDVEHPGDEVFGDDVGDEVEVGVAGILLPNEVLT